MRATGTNGKATVSVAIVGGGPNGVAVFDALMDEISRTYCPQAFEISIYESTGRVGGGLAFGTLLDAHILNMTAGSMSGKAGRPNHFLSWLLRENPIGVSTDLVDEYVPRRVFGVYLEELFRDALDMARAIGTRVSILSEAAVDIEVQAPKVLLRSSSGERRFDFVILCLGNQAPPPDPKLAGCPGYFPHAWPEHRLLQAVPRDAKVLVKGSGLTAVDTFLTLQANRHRGKIIFVSRHGLLPKVRGFPAPYQLRCLDPDKVEAAMASSGRPLELGAAAGMLLEELWHAEGLRMREVDSSKLIRLPLTALAAHRQWLARQKPAKVLQRDIEQLREGQEVLSVLKALDEVVGRIWNSLSPAAQRKFDDDFSALWNAYDYPMPRRNARKILDALESEGLFVGRFDNDGATTFDYPRRKFFTPCILDGRRTVLESDCVINATGQSLNIRKARNPLIQCALRNGIIQSHDRGGIAVDFPTGAVRDASGLCSERVFAVGSLTRGVHVYTNSINENAAAGLRAVQAIMKVALPSIAGDLIERKAS